MPGLYTIIGADDFLVAAAARKIIGDGVGLEVIDSNTSVNEETQLRDIRAARESAMTPPFLEPRRVTWWKNVKFLPGGRIKSDGDTTDDEKEGGRPPSAAVKEAVAAFVEELSTIDFPENQQFIISGPVLLRTSVVAKKLAAAGELMEFDAKQNSRAAQPCAVERAAELGMQFEPGAAEQFIAVVGDDTRSIYSELDKMRAFLGEEKSTISKEDVDTISAAGAGVEPNIWKVMDAISHRNAKDAIAGARRFEGSNGYAIMMTTMIEKQFRQMVELKAASEVGKLNVAVRDMKPFIAQKLCGALGFWTLNELRTARMRFMNLRERLVSGSKTGGSDEDAVTIELVRCLSPAGRREAAR